MEDSVVKTEWERRVSKAFPFGIRVLPADDREDYTIVDLQVESTEGTPVMLGWRSSVKDMYYDLASVEERGEDWYVSSQGAEFLFRPLGKQEGKEALAIVRADI